MVHSIYYRCQKEGIKEKEEIKEGEILPEYSERLCENLQDSDML